MLIDRRFKNSVIHGISTEARSNFTPPQAPFKELILPSKDVDSYTFKFNYQPLIYFSNRNADDEQFSTSMLFAGFTQGDKQYNTNALKSSFYMFDLFYQDERAGYLFSKLTPSNFITGFDETYKISGKFFVYKRFSKISPLLNMNISLRFFNSRLGGVSNFVTVNGTKTYPARVNFQSRQIFLTQTNISFFENWNPLLEELQDNNQNNTPPETNTPTGGIVLPNGNVITVRELVCNDDFKINDNC